MADKKNFWEGLSDNVKIIILFIVMLVGIVLISKVFDINSWLIFGVAILAFLDRQVLVDASRNRAGAMHLFAGRGADDLLAELPHHDALGRQLRILGDDTDDIALFDRCIETEKQIRRSQIKEVQGMGLVHLPVVHEPTHLLTRRGQLFGPDNPIHRLGGAKVVAHRADATKSLHQDRQLPKGTALNEAFETAKLDDMESRLFDAVVLIQEKGDFAVALYPCEGLDNDSSGIRG